MKNKVVFILTWATLIVYLNPFSAWSQENTNGWPDFTDADKRKGEQVKEIRTITLVDTFHRVFNYFISSPYHPDGRRLLYTKYPRNLSDKGYVCIMDLETGKETVIGEATGQNHHTGARPLFTSNGNKVIWQKSIDKVGKDEVNLVAMYDLVTGKMVTFEGFICGYSMSVGDHYIEMDSGFPLEKQGDMGIYIRKNDGTGKRVLATVDDLLAANPQGKQYQDQKELFRLGGQISPDGKKVLLYIVHRTTTRIRDYYICDFDGSNLTFHGRIGTHIIWHPDSRHIVAGVNNKGSSFLAPLLGSDHPKLDSLFYLGIYDTKKRSMKILSCAGTSSPHQAPSPDGLKVVIDQPQQWVEELTLRLYDYASNDMTTLVKEKLTDVVSESPRTRLATHDYLVHAHPVFSPDGRKIIYNSCINGWTCIREITLK